MEAANWVDGGGPQLRSLAEESTMEEMALLKILDLKGNPQRTHREQPADLMSGYRSLKSNQKTTTASQTLFASALKTRILSSLQTGTTKNILRLAPQRADALADFAGCLPNISVDCFHTNHFTMKRGFRNGPRTRFYLHVLP